MICPKCLEKKRDCECGKDGDSRAAHGSAPTISVFATFGEERLHERFATRKAAAHGIRYARAKGGRDIDVFDPWTKKREAQ